MLCFVLSALSAEAQYSDSVFHYAGFSSTGSFNTTNDNSAYLVDNDLKLGLKKKVISMNWISSWVYGEQQHATTNNDFSTLLDCNLHKTLPHFYYWGLATYTTSYSLKINHQGQAGVGVAYNVVDKKDLKFNLSDGILYESNDIFRTDGSPLKYSTYRNSFRVSLKYSIGELLHFASVNYFQHSLSDGNDYIMKSNQSLSVTLAKWLSFTTAVSYNKFRLTNRENTLVTFGLTAERYY